MRTACAVVLTGLLLAGCDAGGDGSADDQAAQAGAVTTLQPGLPGEPAETGPAEVEEVEENHADIAFMQMMIPHHAQAIEMSGLALEHAADDRVRRLAERIKVAQGPEILAMAAWLDERGYEVPRAAEDHSKYDHGAHGHGEMAGMLSEEEMAELADARGARFDRLFLRGMIAHHGGAIEMSAVATEEGADLTVQQMAADVSVTQTVEIDIMRELLRDL